MGAPPRAWLIALATAMQESTLRNINYGDRDSLGLFQQRPSQGWGIAGPGHRPRLRHHAVLPRLLAVPGWDALPLTVAAQTVQRSAFPDAYAQVGRPCGAAGGPAREVSPIPVRCAPRSLAAAAAGRDRFALAEVGKPYVWGATGPDTYDCSGLMLRAFQKRAINLPRVSWQQYQAGGHVPVGRPSPATCCSSPPTRPTPRPSTT